MQQWIWRASGVSTYLQMTKEVEPGSWDGNSSLTALMMEVKALAAALHEDYPVLLEMAEKRIKNAAASGFQGWSQLVQHYDPRNWLI